MKLIKAANNSRVLKEIVAVLKAGGLVIYPTETCYGVGVDATNSEAVKKLLAYKRRPEGKAISVAVCDQAMAEKFVQLNSTARQIYKNFLPGPLTVISKSKGKTVKDLEAEDGTLGIRLPDYSLVIQITREMGRPITATSANSYGKKTPYSIKDIFDNLSAKQKKLIDLVIDAGQLPKNPPSTVINTTLDDLKVLRQGRISFPVAGETKSFLSRSPISTQQFAAKLSRKILKENDNQPVIFALQGDLGAGKTQFAKGVAKGLGIKETVTSPTFLLVKEYRFTKTFYHLDTWRMKTAEELIGLGFWQMLQPGNVVVIEWLEKVKPFIEEAALKKNTKVVWVKISPEDKLSRRISYWL